MATTIRAPDVLSSARRPLTIATASPRDGAFTRHAHVILAAIDVGDGGAAGVIMPPAALCCRRQLYLLGTAGLLPAARREAAREGDDDSAPTLESRRAFPRIPFDLRALPFTISLYRIQFRAHMMLSRFRQVRRHEMPRRGRRAGVERR